MPISIIAAVAAANVIGRGGKLPWRIPADLAYFKRLTMGHGIIMGRKTFQAIGKPLPGRRNIVMTRDPEFHAPGCITARTVPEAMAAAGPGEVFVIGGAEIYSLFMPSTERLYITHIDVDVTGDEFFPDIDERVWRAVGSEQGIVDEKNTLPHRFVVYERRRG
jgi:dihydrofolate reductase